MVTEITNQNKWQDLSSSFSGANFLQSWAWGEFQASTKGNVVRISYQDKLIAQVIKMSLPLGKFYWYIPRGPLFSDNLQASEKAMQELFDYLKKDKALFIRVDPTASAPFWGEGRESKDISPISSTQPQCEGITNLHKSEEELLASMRPKTRYNIRLSQKKAVSVRQGNIEDFLKLNNETKKRDKFISHSDNYYLQMAKTLSNKNFKIWTASCNNQPLASALIIYFNNTATYAHGASSNQNRNKMAPYLLHWQIIKNAKENGYKFYHWGGLNPQDENHFAYKKSWQGITRFKKSFGVDIKCYPNSFDLINNKPWYSLYRLIKKLRLKS